MFRQETASLIAPLPQRLGIWRGQPLSSEADFEKRLSGFTVRSKQYLNPFNERITVLGLLPKDASKKIEPEEFFQDLGYRVTAVHSFQPFSGRPTVVNALILKQGENRVLLYSWSLQLGATPDSVPCTVWVYTTLHPADPDATQARRNLNESGKFLVDFLPKPASSAPSPPVPQATEPAVGTDSSYLDSSLFDDKPGWGKNLLPLTKGTAWEMNATVGGKASPERLVVAGPFSETGVIGVQVDILRDGKKWRRDIYRRQGNRVLLAAAEDEGSDLMGYFPAIPLFEEPVVLGKAISWTGQFAYQGSRKPATGYSRVSNKESLKTPAGQFTAYRIDTVIIVPWGGKDVRFPMVRWLAPGVGFVGRGFADKGRPAFSELVAYKVR